MRFGQFDRVTVSLAESHVRMSGKVAWAVGVERVQLLRKDGETLNLDAFVTNVFENQEATGCSCHIRPRRCSEKPGSEDLSRRAVA